MKHIKNHVGYFFSLWKVMICISISMVMSVKDFSQKSCPLENGYCVLFNGLDQNSGVIKLNSLDGNTVNGQSVCLKECLKYKGATGCEVIWNQRNRGCYVHTQEVSRGNGRWRHACWVFSKCKDRIFSLEDVSVNGAWSTWSAWSEYISGASARKRSCKNPELKDGGRYCPGYAIEVRMLHGGVLAPVGAVEQGNLQQNANKTNKYTRVKRDYLKARKELATVLTSYKNARDVVQRVNDDIMKFDRFLGFVTSAILDLRKNMKLLIEKELLNADFKSDINLLDMPDFK